MRVSDSQRHSAFIQGVQTRLVNMTRIQEEMGTGRSLFTPSEDVSRADQALRADSELASQEQYLRNIDDGMGWVGSADSKLGGVIDLLNEIDALAVAADNDSQTAEDRQRTALEIDQKLEALTSLLNGQHGDRYLFGGYSTTSAPFTFARDAEGRITAMSANEETVAGRIYRRIGQDNDLQINVSGAQLFQPVGEAGTDSDLVYVIATLRDTVANNNTPPAGYEATRSTNYLRDQLDTIRGRITEQQSALGSVGQRLEATKSQIKELQITLTDRSEEAQGVDLTDLVSRLATEEGAYDALAAMGTKLIKQSLVDYLR